MINRQTSGLEMTLIILAEMFDVVIICVFDKYVWKSHDVPLDKSEVFLLLLATGVFASATLNHHYKISVHLPKCVIQLLMKADWNNFSRMNWQREVKICKEMNKP